MNWNFHVFFLKYIVNEIKGKEDNTVLSIALLGHVQVDTFNQELLIK